LEGYPEHKYQVKFSRFGNSDEAQVDKATGNSANFVTRYVLG